VTKLKQIKIMDLIEFFIRLRGTKSNFSL